MHSRNNWCIRGAGKHLVVYSTNTSTNTSTKIGTQLIPSPDWIFWFLFVPICGDMCIIHGKITCFPGNLWGNCPKNGSCLKSPIRDFENGGTRQPHGGYPIGTMVVSILSYGLMTWMIWGLWLRKPSIKMASWTGIITPIPDTSNGSSRSLERGDWRRRELATTNHLCSPWFHANDLGDQSWPKMKAWYVFFGIRHLSIYRHIEMCTCVYVWIYVLIFHKKPVGHYVQSIQ